MSTEVTDYSGWMHSLPASPTQKDWKQLQQKLNTYAQGSKFIRDGSTVQQVDSNTGKLVRKPVMNVVHKMNPEDKTGIRAQDLRSMIQQAVLTGDRDLLKEVSKYRYYTADKFVSPEEIKKQLDRKKRKRLLVGALVLGGIGSTAGALPFIADRKQGKSHTAKTFQDALALGGLGAAAGVGTAGLIEAMR